MAPRDRHQDESQNGVDPPPQHVHYHQTKNGNGSTLNVLLGLCGALLLILVAITGFMWKSQIDFQSTMIDRMARVETKLGLTQP